MRLIPALLTALAAISLCAAASAAPKPEECLKCHGGTLESLAAQTKNYKAPSGETVNPHVYIDKLAANRIRARSFRTVSSVTRITEFRRIRAKSSRRM